MRIARARKILGQRLDADADERRQHAGLSSAARHGLRGGDGVSVFFVVGPVAVAVLEVDAVVLDRLALELGEGPFPDALRESFVRQAEAGGQVARVGEMLAREIDARAIPRLRPCPDLNRCAPP